MKLTLSLKRIWFEMISNGIKAEEYREIKPYWEHRFLTKEGKITEQYDEVEFTLGYPPKEDFSRRIAFKIDSIQIGKGNPNWGAPIDDVFIIKLGKRI